MQRGRGLTQGIKSFSQLWKSCRKDGGWDLFQEIWKYRDHKEATAIMPFTAISAACRAMGGFSDHPPESCRQNPKSAIPSAAAHILPITASRRGFPGGSDGKESACNAGDLGSTPALGRFLGGGHSNPLHYSCLKNPYGQRNLASYSPWGHRVRHE